MKQSLVRDLHVIFVLPILAVTSNAQSMHFPPNVLAATSDQEEFLAT